MIRFLKRFWNVLKFIWNKLKLAFSGIKAFAINSFIVCLVGLLSYAIVKEIYNDSILFNATEVPQVLVDKGFNGVVISRRIVEKINQIKEVAEDSVEYTFLPKEHFPSVILSSTSPELNFEVPKTGLYFSSIIGFFRRYFNNEVATVSSDIVIKGENILLTLNYKNSVIQKQVNKDSIEEAIDFAGIGLLEKLQPLTVAFYLFKVERYIECEKILKNNFSKYSNKQMAQAYTLLGSLIMTKDDYSSVDEKSTNNIKLKRLLNQALKYDSSQVLALAMLWDITKDKNESNKLLSKVINIPKKSAYEHYIIGYMYEVEQDTVKAEYYFKQALEINPRLTTAIYDLADIKEEQKKYSEAENYYLELLRVQPNDIFNHYMIAVYYAKIKKYSEAEEYALDGLSLDSKSYQFYKLLALINDINKNYKQAEKYYQTYARLNLSTPDSWITLGKFYYEHKEYSKAEKAYRTAYNKGSKDKLLIYKIGTMIHLQKKFKKAERFFKFNLRKNPNDSLLAKGVKIVRKEMRAYIAKKKKRL